MLIFFFFWSYCLVLALSSLYIEWHSPHSTVTYLVTFFVEFFNFVMKKEIKELGLALVFDFKSAIWVLNNVITKIVYTISGSDEVVSHWYRRRSFCRRDKLLRMSCDYATWINESIINSILEICSTYSKFARRLRILLNLTTNPFILPSCCPHVSMHIAHLGHFLEKTSYSHLVTLPFTCSASTPGT